MTTDTDKVIQLRKDLAVLMLNGCAAYYHGIIVTPAFSKVLQQASRVTSDAYGIRGVEGNQRIHYKFYILEDPSLAEQGRDYLLTHFTKERWQNEILGRIAEVLKQKRKTVKIGFITVEELNPVCGIYSISPDRCSTQWHYNHNLEDIVGPLQTAYDENGNLREVLKLLENDGVVRNPPETEWLGEIKFDTDGKLVSSTFNGPLPYAYVDGDNPAPLVGRLLMNEHEGIFRTVAVCKDGYGNARVIPTGVEAKNRMDFIPLVINDFFPEEIFLFLKLNWQKQLEDLKSRSHQDIWGIRYDPEAIGRINEGDWKETYELYSYVLNTRAKTNHVLITTVPKAEKDALKTQYFPADWTGWGKTKLDHTVEKMAQTLR